MINKGGYSNKELPIETFSQAKARQEEYSKEMQDILANAKRDSEGNLLAPNGKKSNLTERQYAQVRTKAFKDWFGDWENNPSEASKVVDENGEPLVVYHDGGYNISKFKKDEYGNIYFGDPLTAATYGGSETSVFLNIKFPIIIEGNNEEIGDATEKQYGSRRLSPKMGNDGVIYKNVKDVGEGIYNFDEDEIIKFWEDYETQGYGVVYSVINPNQIKSATDNIGTFDSNNPDIRYRKVPSIAELRAKEKSAYERFNNDIEEYYREARDIIKEVNYRRFDTEREAMKAFNESGIRKDFFYRITREGANNAAGYKIQLLTRDMIEQYKQDNNPYSDEYEDYTTPVENFYFDSLDPEVQMMLFDKGWTKEQFDSISQQERDQAVKCIAL